MATELRTDGPHSPEYTREVGNVLAEAVRVLNYASLATPRALSTPATSTNSSPRSARPPSGCRSCSTR